MFFVNEEKPRAQTSDISGDGLRHDIFNRSFYDVENFL